MRTFKVSYKQSTFRLRLNAFYSILILPYCCYLCLTPILSTQRKDKLRDKSSISSPQPSNSPVPCPMSESDEDSTEQGDTAFSSSQLPYKPLRSSSSCDPQNTEPREHQLPSSVSVSDMPPTIPPPPPPPNVRGKRGRGVPRGASSGRSRPHRNVSSTRSQSSSQLMRPKASSNNSPFNLSLLALQPFSGLSNPFADAEGSEASSPLQRKLDEKPVIRLQI